MNIEVGKYYRTSGGRKARIYATDGSTPYTIHGAIVIENEWSSMAWITNGDYLGRKQAHPHDLIAEWADKPEVDWSKMPAWANFVAMDKSGEWYWFVDKPSPSNNTAFNVWSPSDFEPLNGRIPIHCPIFTGDWKESLVQRP